LLCYSGVGGTYQPLRPFAPPSRLANLPDVLSCGGWFRVSLACRASVPGELRATTFAAVFLWRVGALSPTLHLLLPTCRLAALLGVRVLRVEPRPSAGVAVPGASLAALSLTGTIMLHIHRKGNTASTWSNMLNVLVDGLPAFLNFLQELLFDQVDMSAGRLRRFTAPRNESGRIGRGAGMDSPLRGALTGSPLRPGGSPTWPVAGRTPSVWPNGARTQRGAVTRPR